MDDIERRVKEALYRYERFLRFAQFNNGVVVLCTYIGEALVSIHKRENVWEIHRNTYDLVAAHENLDDALYILTEVIESHVAMKLMVRI